MPGFVFTYGRFNPPTIGHGILFREIVRRAEEMDATPVIVVSHKNTTSKNPLTAEEKVEVIKRVFPGVDVRASAPGKLISAVTGELVEEYGGPGMMLLGSNRIEAGNMKFLEKIHGITREQAGGARQNNNMNARSATAASGTKTRAIASKEVNSNYTIENKRANFRSQIINQSMTNNEINRLMNLIQHRVGVLPSKTPPKKRPPKSR